MSSSTGVSASVRVHGRIASSTRVPNSVLAPAVILFLIGSAFVAARLIITAHGDPSRFALVATAFAYDPALLPHVHIFPGTGFDGQFTYRLALDPFNVHLRTHGIVLDSPLRAQRIGLPFLAWLLALGQSGAVPWTIVVVNLVALTACGWAGAMLARDGGRSPLWGILPAAYWAEPTSLGRDLTEILSTACVLLGMLAWTRGRPATAGFVFLLGVLTRETDLVVVIGVGASCIAASGVFGGRIRSWLGGGSSPSFRSQSVWVLPILGFAAWQVVCRAQIGAWPITASGNDNLTAPFAGITPFIGAWVRGANSFAGALQLGEAVLLVILLVVAASRVAGKSPVSLRLSWCFLAVLLLCLSRYVYYAPGAFRTATEMFSLGMVLLLWKAPGGGDRANSDGTVREPRGSSVAVGAWYPGDLMLGLLAVAVVALWLGEAALRVHAI